MTRSWWIAAFCLLLPDLPGKKYTPPTSTTRFAATSSWGMRRACVMPAQARSDRCGIVNNDVAICSNVQTVKFLGAPLWPLSGRAHPSLLSYLYLVSVGFTPVLSDLTRRWPPFAVSVSVSGRSSVSVCPPSPTN